MESINREDHTNTDRANELQFRTAYKLAGRAVAIYLNNSQKKLPEILFHIKVSEQSYQISNDPHYYDHSIEGGRLVSSLSISSISTNQGSSFSKNHPNDVENSRLLDLAETDIFNFLVGPIATAKYVSIIDDECFNVHLLTVNSLKYYGGSKDLILIDEYLNCFWQGQNDKSEILSEIFNRAFHFISEPEKWLIIKTLAHFIFEQKKPLIDYQEIASIIEAADCLNQEKQNSLTTLWRLKNKG